MKIENATHWRTSDIKRIVRLALARAGGDTRLTRNVNVDYLSKRRNGNTSVVRVKLTGALKIYNGKHQANTIWIYLPKRGPRDHHSNPMVTLAIATDIADAGFATDDVVLAASQSYFLANYLAFRFAEERIHLQDEVAENMRELEDNCRAVMAPSWADSKKLLIAKYRDPLKDGSFLGFMAKKEETIRRAEADMEKIDNEIAKLQDRRKRAVARKTQAAKAIRDAKKRRS